MKKIVFIVMMLLSAHANAERPISLITCIPELNLFKIQIYRSQYMEKLYTDRNYTEIERLENEYSIVTESNQDIRRNFGLAA